MTWWIGAAIVLVVITLRALRAYKHPSSQFGIQAARLGWQAVGSVKDSLGFRNTRLVRGDYESIILFRKEEVRLTKPEAEYSFKDYGELERWLSEYESRAQEEDPEILYYQSIDSYVRSVGYDQPLLKLKGTGEEYCIAVMKAQKAAYLANVPGKIAGALTLDSLKHYYQKRDLALSFLRKLESRWLAESRADVVSAPHLVERGGSDDEDNFHPSLDKVVDLVQEFFTEAGGYDLAGNPRTELVAYAATYIAMKMSDREMPSGCWNTFKTAIENRMLSIADDGSRRSGTIRSPDGPAYAHFTSSYWAEMETIDDLANKSFASASSSRDLCSYLFHALGGAVEQERAFEELFSSLIELASQAIFPIVKRVFS